MGGPEPQCGGGGGGGGGGAKAGNLNGGDRCDKMEPGGHSPYTGLLTIDAK